MIESRIKRALSVLSIAIGLGYGSQAVIKLANAREAAADLERWQREESPWYWANCERSEPNSDPDSFFRTRSVLIHTPVCDRMRITRDHYRSTSQRGVAAVPAAVAVGGPIAIWTLFFLGRWIWTGTAWPPRASVEGRAGLLSTNPRRYGALVLGIVFLVAVNALVLPAGRAKSVLISSVVQGVGAAVLVWILARAGRRRNKRGQ